MSATRDRAPRGRSRGFFNRPLVLLALMAACVGVIAYMKWPLDEETLFRRGAELMASRRLSDQEEAWHEYLEPLEQRYPETAHRAELDKFRRKLMLTRGSPWPPSEAERFVRRGIDLREQGKDDRRRSRVPANDRRLRQGRRRETVGRRGS